jgi:hypothetical protein
MQHFEKEFSGFASGGTVRPPAVCKHGTSLPCLHCDTEAIDRLTALSAITIQAGKPKP